MQWRVPTVVDRGVDGTVVSGPNLTAVMRGEVTLVMGGFAQVQV